jgi:hypothetical protein
MLFQEFFILLLFTYNIFIAFCRDILCYSYSQEDSLVENTNGTNPSGRVT